MLHAVDAGSAAAMRTGMRVRPRWAASRVGSIRDIACFEPCDERRPSRLAAARTRATRSRSTMTITPVRLRYDAHRLRPRRAPTCAGWPSGRLIGQRCRAAGRCTSRPGACPADGVPTDEEVELPDIGTVTTFCIVNVGYPGQHVTPPYVAAAVLLDGADIAFQHLILGCEPGEVRMGLRVRRPAWDDDSGETSATSRRPGSRTPPTRPMRGSL